MVQLADNDALGSLSAQSFLDDAARHCATLLALAGEMSPTVRQALAEALDSLGLFVVVNRDPLAEWQMLEVLSEMRRGLDALDGEQ